MAIPIKKYRIRGNRMAAGIETGFYAGNDGLKLLQKEHIHRFRLDRLDSTTENCIWGRLVIDARLPDASVLTVWVYASDEDCLVPELCMKKVDAYDFLLYEQRGRYLWIWLEVAGMGEGIIREMQVYTPGDTFLNTFPEIYREQGSFFHRYLSIFSSIYMDFQERIDRFHTCLDLESAPYEVLPVLADWLGIQVEDSLLEGEELCRLLQEAPYLIRYKGTRGAVERISELILKARVILVERNAALETETGMEETLERLYGTCSYDFTILALREYDEMLKMRLLGLLDQFKPARSQVNLVFLKKNSMLDGYCYLDINASVHERTAGRLESGSALDDGSFMKETTTGLV